MSDDRRDDAPSKGGSSLEGAPNGSDEAEQGDRPDLPSPPAELVAEAEMNPRLDALLDQMTRLRELTESDVEDRRRERKQKEEKKEGKGGKDKGGKKKVDSLGTSRGIETMFRTSYRTHIDLSSLADTKANIMISINGIIISILIASISPRLDQNEWLFVPTTFLLIGAVCAVVYAVLAARPRVSKHTVTLEDVEENRANILFFGNFVTMDEDDFVEGMKDLMMDTERLYTNMIRDLYSLGGVLAKKFRLLRISYNLFMVSLVVGVSLYIVVFVGVALFGWGDPPLPPVTEGF